jgi:hypothetical protein
LTFTSGVVDALKGDIRESAVESLSINSREAHETGSEKSRTN